MFFHLLQNAIYVHRPGFHSFLQIERYNPCRGKTASGLVVLTHIESVSWLSYYRFRTTTCHVEQRFNASWLCS